MNHACVTEYLQEQSIKVRILKTTEAATWSVLWKRVFLKILQNSQACNFIKNKTLAQVFSCEKNTFLQKTSGQLLLKTSFYYVQYLQEIHWKKVWAFNTVIRILVSFGCFVWQILIELDKSSTKSFVKDKT